MNIFRAIRAYTKLYKKAIEVEDWVDPRIRKELKELKEAPKDTRLINFRKPVHMEKIAATLSKNEIEFRDDYLRNMYNMGIILGNCERILTHKLIPKDFTNRFGRSLLANIRYIENMVFEVESGVDQARLFIENIVTDSVNIKNQIKLTKLYENERSLIKKIYNRLMDNIYDKIPNASIIANNIEGIGSGLREIKALNELNKFKEWQLRPAIGKRGGPAEYEIVFSTDYKDIYGMSSRSDWTSCMKITGQNIKYMLAKCIVGSCVAKGVGVIYLTDKSIYEGRGERMLYRSAVWIIRHKKTGEEILLLPKLYPSWDERIIDAFKAALTEKLGMNILCGDDSPAEIFEDYEREITEEEVESKAYHPYSDVQIDAKLTAGAKLAKLKEKVMGSLFKIVIPNTLIPLGLYYGDVVTILSPSIRAGIISTAVDAYKNGDFEKLINDKETSSNILEGMLHLIQDNSIYRNIFINAVDKKIDEIGIDNVLKNMILSIVKNNSIFRLVTYGMLY